MIHFNKIVRQIALVTSLVGLWVSPGLCQENQVETRHAALANGSANIPASSTGAGPSSTPQWTRILDRIIQRTDLPDGTVPSLSQQAQANRGLSLLGNDPSDSAQSPLQVGSGFQLVLLLSVLSLAPAILLMTTCYVRIIIVLGLLRQALGTNQLPPTQVLTSISIFMTIFIMAPVWNRVYEDAIKPYSEEGSQMSMEQAWNAGVAPIREFMINQIEYIGNQDDVHLFYNYHTRGGTPAANYGEVPTQVLLPAFMLSELKTAFFMGFLIYLPFLIIDLVVAAVTISMGMMMLPPAMISMPFKLLLFVLVDGWHLVVDMLLQSFGALG